MRVHYRPRTAGGSGELCVLAVSLRGRGPTVARGLWKNGAGSDKTFCIYIADNAELIDEHAERSGFRASVVTPVKSEVEQPANGFRSDCRATR